MKVRRAFRIQILGIALGILALMAGMGNFAGRAGSPADFRYPGEDHYRWLLESPVRAYLSGAAQNYLWMRYGNQVELPWREDQAEELRGLNIRVNDRGQDENPSVTTQSETAVSVFGANVVTGWNDLGEFLETGSITGYGYSTDGGQTFTDGGVVPPVEGGLNLGDPDIAVDGDGVFYFSQISVDSDGIAFIGVARSGDGGRTFSQPANASWSVSGPNSFQDKEFMAADGTGGPFDGNVYVTWTRFSPRGSRIYLARSTDGGRSFRRAVPLSPPGHFVQGSIPRVGPNGGVYVAWEDFSAPGIFVARSTDGGRTFEPPRLAAKVEFIGQAAPEATCGGRRILNGFVDAAFEFPTLALNPANGEVYVTYNSNPPGIDQSDVYLVRSDDQGRTWSEPVRLNDDPTSNDQWMPAMTVAPDGTLGAIWYDRRSDPRNLRFHVFMATSQDGGRTWQPNERVTDVPSEVPPLSPNFDLARPCYMADYNDITADGQNFYLAWGDNRERGLTWETHADMPTPREATANAALGHAAFAIGGRKLGFREAGDSALNEAYHARSGQWIRLAPMPTPRSEAAAVSRALSVFVLGGQSSKFGGVTDAFERYDALADRWHTLPPLPTPRTGLGAARVGSKIFAIGGQSCVSPFCGRTLDTVEFFDLTTGRWSEAAPLPEPRAYVSTAVVAGKIYVIGGLRGPRMEAYDSILAYNPRTDEWTKETELSTGRFAAAAGVCGDTVIVTGGLSESFSLLRRDAWLYNTITGAWSQVAAPKFGRAGVAAVNAGGRLFAIGGSGESRVEHAGANESFDCSQLGHVRPDPDVFFAIKPIPQPRRTSTDVPSPPEEEAENASPMRVRPRLSRTTAGLVFHIEGTEPVRGMRLQIYGLDGAPVFDSGFRHDSRIQWNLSTDRGTTVANGAPRRWRSWSSCGERRAQTWSKAIRSEFPSPEPSLPPRHGRRHSRTAAREAAFMICISPLTDSRHCPGAERP